MKRYIKSNDDWREHNHPYGFEGKPMDQYTAEDWAYYLATSWDWLREADYEELLSDLNNLRGAEWVWDYEPELKELGCLNEIAKFTGAFEVTTYDGDLESEIFEFCDELGGYVDYNQKVESVAEEWSMPKDLAEKYVWNWSLQSDDEEDD